MSIKLQPRTKRGGKGLGMEGASEAKGRGRWIIELLDEESAVPGKIK